MVWGVGALFCRELVRRWRAGSASLLFLGLALSIAGELITVVDAHLDSLRDEQMLKFLHHRHPKP